MLQLPAIRAGVPVAVGVAAAVVLGPTLAPTKGLPVASTHHCCPTLKASGRRLHDQLAKPPVDHEARFKVRQAEDDQGGSVGPVVFVDNGDGEFLV